MKSKRLFNKDIILIDKNNKDYSELEKALDNYNKSGRAKPKTMFVIYKQDQGKELKKIDFIQIDLIENYNENNYYVLLSAKKIKNKTFTGISHYQRAWNGKDAPVEKEYIEVDTIYHPVFYVRPFGDKDELDFHLVHFDISRKDAFTATGQSLLKGKE